MCTVSWLRTRHGFELWCNRDEARTRALAEAPRFHEVDGMRALFPVDAEAGGTWVGVNERGLALCLVNAYPAPEADAERFLTRGQIVKRLLAAHDRLDALDRLEQASLERFRPFQLLLLEPNAPAGLATWRGHALEFDELPDAARPLVSAPGPPAGIAAQRRALLRELAKEHGGLSAAVLEAFHESHAPERGPLSPCFHGAHSETVSHTHVAVDEELARMRYADGAPCQGGAPIVDVLPLAGRG